MAFNSVWKRYACCPENQSDLPAPIENLVVFELSGYNYQTIPEWFDEHKNKMIPLQSSADTRALWYKFVFYKTIPPESTFYFLSTYDDIMPVIIDGISGNRYNVQRFERHNGYTVWSLILS